MKAGRWIDTDPCLESEGTHACTCVLCWSHMFSSCLSACPRTACVCSGSRVSYFLAFCCMLDIFGPRLYNNYTQARNYERRSRISAYPDFKCTIVSASSRFPLDFTQEMCHNCHKCIHVSLVDENSVTK